MQLALSLLATSPTARVGLLDLDLTGPSLPRMLGLDIPSASVHQSSAGWIPVYVDQKQRLGCMSIGFLLKERGDSVVWRGPKKDGMIRQFLQEVRWGELDYLVIDTPPGMCSSLVQCTMMLTENYRNFRRAHLTPYTSSPSIHHDCSPADHSDIHPHHDATNDIFKRHVKVAVIHAQTSATRPRSGREHGRLRMPVLWRDQ